MKSYILFLLLPCLSFSLLQAQENAADFDGTTGYINVEQASAFLPPDAMTIEAWVFPRNEAPGWPDFDGLFGIRNESNCDFYLLQLGLETIEARFRNSDGQDFTIVNGGLVINQWNHLALTYGENLLTFYLNGQFQQVISAEGVCGDMSLPFTMGKLNFDGNNDFYFDGLLDDVRVWSEARTEDQIEQYYNCKIQDPESFPTLSFYYDLDENTGATSVTDRGDTGVNGEVIEGVTFTASTVEYKVVNHTQQNSLQSIQIYPNPTRNSITIDMHDQTFKKLQIVNQLGQNIAFNHEMLSDSKYLISDLKPGVYYLTYADDHSTHTSSFIVLD